MVESRGGVHSIIEADGLRAADGRARSPPLNAVFGGPGIRRVALASEAPGVDSSTMATPTSREQIIEALQDLPGDATFDDAIERLIFLAKIDAGLAELDEGKGVPHDEVKRQLSQ